MGSGCLLLTVVAGPVRTCNDINNENDGGEDNQSERYMACQKTETA